jgi:hypothetical protein
MKIEPTCDWCAKPYAEAKSIHPHEDQDGFWLCEKCVAKAGAHTFDPDKISDSARNQTSNGEIAERAASAVCEYTGISNPDEFNISDVITDIGHFCDREGHDFRVVLRTAVAHWEAER